MLCPMPLTPILIGLFIFAGFCALFSLTNGVGARRRWRERHRFAAGYRGLWSVVFLLLALLGAFSASALLGYRRLTAETILADIQSRQIAPQRYAVRVDFPDGSHRDLDISGDQWQLDARVIKWRSTAVMMGAPALYQLDRISGRYIDATQEAERPRTVIDLAMTNPFDLLDLQRRFPKWLPFVDADYGSAAYLLLVDGGRYRVTLSPGGGLVARPLDRATAQKLGSAEPF